MIIEFNSRRSDVAFCLVDDTHTYASTWAAELMKNQADYTIANVNAKGFSLFQGLDEDQLLKHVAALGFTHAVVFTTGTEFVNGDAFFNAINDLITTNFAIAGHVLDRGDAYYELHSQCYVVNLHQYNTLGQPSIGKQELGARHEQYAPYRSIDNIHDDYTPTTIVCGFTMKAYAHKCHGWNILSKVLDVDAGIVVFADAVRNSKRHHYPESLKDFQEKLSWIYFRERYCSTEFVHTANTESGNPAGKDIRQLVIPASGLLYTDCLDTTQHCNVVFYDYNAASLDYWKAHTPALNNVSYEFVQLDLLGEEIDVTTFIDKSLEHNTLINLSNIFCYEGTTMLSPLTYRVFKENQLLSNLQKHVPNAQVNFTLRAASSFAELTLLDKAINFKLTDISALKKPTWHTNRDWL